MRAVVQRVTRAQVSVAGETIGKIGHGLCVFVAAMAGDQERDAESLSQKIAQLRIFVDTEEKMNLNVQDVAGDVLVISQFTLAGDVRKGNRPSFVAAMHPDQALPLFNHFCSTMRQYGTKVETGRFRADMQVELVNDGPVTILLDTSRLF